MLPNSWLNFYSFHPRFSFLNFYSFGTTGKQFGSSAQRVGFFNIGSGRVLDKIPGSGPGLGRVGVSKNMIGYFRVPFLLSGISGYVGYFRVFLGLPIYTRVIF